jgi:hypothetical protein
MMQADEVAKILAGLGIGTGAGAAVTAIINSLSSRGKSRAEAADLLVGAAERVGKLNAELDEELRQTRTKLDQIEVLVIQYLANQMTREELLEEMRAIRWETGTA